MVSVPVPRNFDGKKFASKFGLTGERDFYINVFNGERSLIVPSLDELAPEDIADCVADTERVKRVHDRAREAESHAKAIPGWATMDEAQALEWFNANLSDEIIDSFQVPANIKQFMKAQNTALRNVVRMLIAQRNALWPELPEGDTQ